MFERAPERLSKAIQYFFTPFAYPNRFFSLVGLTLSNRPLVRELVHWTEHRKWLESAGIRTVIDVGGYIGAFALAARTILPQAQIYSFEPLPDNFKALVQNLSPLGGFKAFNTAVGDSSGSIDFWQNDFSASSSALPMEALHKEAFPQTANSRKVTVPIARLDDCLDQMELKSRVLLKLDVQGYEGAALRGAEKLLQQVDYIVAEVSYQPLYQGQISFEEIQEQLTTAGFRYAGSFEALISPKDGSILQSDALFVRSQRA